MTLSLYALKRMCRTMSGIRQFEEAAGGYGTVGAKGGKPFLEVKSGKIEIHQIKYVERT